MSMSMRFAAVVRLILAIGCIQTAMCSIRSTNGGVNFTLQQQFPDLLKSNTLCMKQLRDVFGYCFKYLEQMRKLRDTMADINNGFSRLAHADHAVMHVAGVESLAHSVKDAMSTARPSLIGAYETINQLDGKAEPLKQTCEAGIYTSGLALASLERIRNISEVGLQYLNSSLQCDHLVQGNYVKDLEDFLMPILDHLMSGANLILLECFETHNFITAITQWPDVSGFLSSITKFNKDLQPIFSIFSEIQDVLNIVRNESSGVDGMNKPLPDEAQRPLADLSYKLPSLRIREIPNMKEQKYPDVDIPLLKLNVAEAVHLINSVLPVTWPSCLLEVPRYCDQRNPSILTCYKLKT